MKLDYVESVIWGQEIQQIQVQKYLLAPLNLHQC